VATAGDLAPWPAGRQTLRPGLTVILRSGLPCRPEAELRWSPPGHGRILPLASLPCPQVVVSGAHLVIFAVPTAPAPEGIDQVCLPGGPPSWGWLGATPAHSGCGPGCAATTGSDHPKADSLRGNAASRPMSAAAPARRAARSRGSGTISRHLCLLGGALSLAAMARPPPDKPTAVAEGLVGWAWPRSSSVDTERHSRANAFRRRAARSAHVPETDSCRLRTECMTSRHGSTADPGAHPDLTPQRPSRARRQTGGSAAQTLLRPGCRCLSPSSPRRAPDAAPFAGQSDLAWASRGSLSTGSITGVQFHRSSAPSIRQR